MNKKILLMFVFLLALPVVNAFCYQESANVSTACGGLDTGLYDDTTGIIYGKGGCAHGFVLMMEIGVLMLQVVLRCF